MSEFSKVVHKSSERKDSQTDPQLMNGLERRGSGLGPSLLEKSQEFFQICDSEGKGYITPTDMRKLDKELPLSEEELDKVFDSLDSDRNGFLSLEEFSSGFSDFLHGHKPSQTENQVIGVSDKIPETVYQSQGPQDSEEERHFSMLMESLGASNVFEDPTEVRTLWARLRKDEPHLLYNFEEFLARVTSQIRVARQEKNEMESALRKKAATHSNEIQWLYKEMEQHIKNEEDKKNLMDVRSQDLQQQLSSKEQELEHIFLKQKMLEQQCQELQTEHQESQVENLKLKMTNQELFHELEHTSHELSLAQQQMAILKEQASRRQQERDMELYRVTEKLHKEKQSLIKQIDLLREMNKNLKYEQGINSSKYSSLMQNHTGLMQMDQSDGKQTIKRDASTEDIQLSNMKLSSLANGHALQSTSSLGSEAVSSGFNVMDHSTEDWLLHRVISIEEDHLPHLLQRDPHPLLHNLREEEEGEAGQDVHTELQISPVCLSGLSIDSLVRGQPVGRETLHKAPMEFSVSIPQRLFKVILVGNSNVGKTALLRRFCDGQFQLSTTATVGIDFSVRMLDLGDSRITLQLWDTAGQERYQSITKQFFRKADGVVVIYDISKNDSFRAVQPWLVSIQETVGGAIPVMLLGNKSDRESLREVAFKEGERLAKEAHLLFYECSAYTGYNVQEAMVHLARVLKEQEDKDWENTVQLLDQPVKKKRSCCK